MAFIFDEVWVNNGQLVVGAKNIRPPDALGKGAGRVRHSAYIEGPLQVGDAGNFSKAQGTVMIGNDGNTGASKALYVKGDTEVEGNINATKNIMMEANAQMDINAQNINVEARCMMKITGKSFLTVNTPNGMEILSGIIRGVSCATKDFNSYLDS